MKQPNILFIMTDNHPADLLGCYGNTEIHTPQLDKLASEGIQFNQAYCVNAMCSPCRASVLTGLMPSQHGIHTWIDDRNMDGWPENWNALAEFETLPEILKENGYQTALIGKYHLGSAEQAQNGFDHWVTFPHGHTRNFHGNRFIENGSSHTYSGHSVDGFTEKSIDYLKSVDKSQPFFMFLSYNGPYGHWPSIKGKAEHRFADYYDDCPMNSVPREGISKEAIEKYLLRQEKSGGGLDYSATLRIPNDMETLRNYYSQMTLVDDCIGQVLDELDTQGIAKDTLVVYTTDHGFSLGQHGFWGHGQATWPANAHQSASHISLLMRHKGSIEAGQVSDELVSQIDLFPSLLKYANVEIKSEIPNSSVSIPIVSDADSKRDAIYMEQEETRTIRTKQWLYMQRYHGHPEHPFQDELYDLEKDPAERINLIEDNAYSATIAELKEKLEAHFSTYSNPKYDLWNGGTTKSNSDKAWYWQNVWGEDWSPVF